MTCRPIAGADSVGLLGALNRVYLNIGLFSEEWLLHFNPVVGGKTITPIKIASAQKNTADAERLLREATALELTLDPPSGPPEPIKPSFEVFAEWLAEQGRAKEAAAQFQQSLLRMPNRRAAVQGLAKTSGGTTSQGR